MPARVSTSKSQAASPATLGVVGLAFMAAGIGLLGLAFSTGIFGRLVTYAWAVGVAGLVFLIPGAVAAGYGLVRSLEARRLRDGTGVKRAP